jgi:hypothetical protein
MYVSTVVSEYRDGACGRRRDEVDALAEEVVADSVVRAEGVGENEGSRGDLSGNERAELRGCPPLLVSAWGNCEACATEVSILSDGDVMMAI